MKVYHNLQSYSSSSKTIVTLGTFDGVHIGHRVILEKLKTQANINSLESLVLTFFPHPRMVLQQNSEIKLLNTIAEKIQLLESINIDNLIIHPFDIEFSRLTAEEFVKDILVDKLNTAKIIIGYDHRFGRNRTATIEDLIEFGKLYNFEVEQILAKELDEVTISSTKIRKALENGNISLANEFLGYNYFISGKIISGKKIGRTIDFPTANIKIEENYKLIPKNGVYIVSSEINKVTVFGMMNIGNNPTVDGNSESIEVHFLNFNQDLYNEKLKISFITRIRDEEKFNSIEELKNQLKKDRNFTINFLNSEK